MSKRLTPQRKKQLEYTKDHYVIAENPHHFRKSWPKKKRRVNQVLRHKVNQALAKPQNAADPTDIEVRVLTVARKPFLHPKWGVVTLRERIEIRQLKRSVRLGWNFFKSDYSSKYDRGPFAAFLETLMAGKTGEAIDHARAVKAWLQPVQAPTPWLSSRDRYKWVRAFLKDEPQFEQRLHRWIEETLREDEG